MFKVTVGDRFRDKPFHSVVSIYLTIRQYDGMKGMVLDGQQVIDLFNESSRCLITKNVKAKIWYSVIILKYFFLNI